MDVNRSAYLTLVVGMILSSFFLASSLILNVIWPESRNLSSSIASIGVGILVLTPYIGVIVIAIVSAVNRDFKLTLISLIVLVVMLIGLFLGLYFRRIPKG